MSEHVDLLVRTTNPKYLDETVQQLGPAVLVEESPGLYLAIDDEDGWWKEGGAHGYVVRVLDGAHAGFVEFAITHQGYGEVVRRLETGEVDR